ncbi:H-2 class II histocompatibility antigen, E-S beta chain-like [Myxocyprinus asiaticus]|uniref:H-2 class II histocompatibility antigen, E-S beta chain-like n=1 Tax=Myxocyprinus asiaticus TaxID=70543 RepID=UPI002221A054|nr:H-2 class II histocompatibility antigen, E-S beta chain-like [Myxocyprinus asiaticus]
MLKSNLLCFLLILMLSVFTGGADAYFGGSLDRCIYSTRDYSDMVYIDAYFFNKIIDVQFNSTVGKFVGYTDRGVRTAENWNNNPDILQQERAEVDRYCKYNAQIDDSCVRDVINTSLVSVKPTVKITSVKQPHGGHQAMLMCSAFRFYPQRITVSWLKDGKPVTSDVTSTEELANGDWYYQIHSHLEYTPKSGEKISCMVDHASFNKPMIVDWDPSLPESERNKIVIGASGLVLGIVIAAAGLIYYKKKSKGRILVPH